MAESKCGRYSIRDRIYSVADPGFPVGGVLTCWGGANLRRIHFLAKTYVKMKEIDPVGGGAPRYPPPGSANDITTVGFSSVVKIN